MWLIVVSVNFIVRTSGKLCRETDKKAFDCLSQFLNSLIDKETLKSIQIIQLCKTKDNISEICRNELETIVYYCLKKISLAIFEVQKKMDPVYLLEIK